MEFVGQNIQEDRAIHKQRFRNLYRVPPAPHLNSCLSIKLWFQRVTPWGWAKWLVSYKLRKSQSLHRAEDIWVVTIQGGRALWIPRAICGGPEGSCLSSEARLDPEGRPGSKSNTKKNELRITHCLPENTQHFLKGRQKFNLIKNFTYKEINVTRQSKQI